MAWRIISKHACFAENTVHTTSIDGINRKEILNVETNKNLFKELDKWDDAKWSSVHEQSQANNN